MRTLMTCDDAFERLTAGPVELDSGDAVHLNEHLDSCESCRELADALRPACHLLHESLPPRQRSDLPIVLSAGDVRVRQIMRQIRAAPSARRRNLIRPSTIIGLALSACVLVLFVPWGRSSEGPRSAMEVNRALASLRLPDPCQLVRSSAHARGAGPDVYASDSCEDCHEAPQSLNAVTFVCCTQCHASGSSPRPAIEDKAPLLMACDTCH